jgi:hypothetical protein
MGDAGDKYRMIRQVIPEVTRHEIFYYGIGMEIQGTGNWGGLMSVTQAVTDINDFYF